MAHVPERERQADLITWTPQGKMRLPDFGEIGPALRALTPRQRRFVLCFLAGGARNASAAYRDAGYGGDNDTVKANAWRLIHDPKIQQAIAEETKARLQGNGAALASELLLEVMQNPTAATKDRLRAAELTMNRTGLHATTEHKMTVEHSVDETTLINKVKRLSLELGLDADKLLAGTSMALQAPAAVDAEFEVVEEVDWTLDTEVDWTV